MTNLKLDVHTDDLNIEVLNLARRIFKNYIAKKPFDQHNDYKLFKLNDSKYLDALSLLSNQLDFKEILSTYTNHYENRLSIESLTAFAQYKPSLPQSFIAFSENGNTSRVKVFNTIISNFYLGFYTRCPDIFLKPGILQFLPQSIQYGIALNKYVHTQELINDPHLYMSLIARHNTFLKKVLTLHNITLEFRHDIATLIYTKELPYTPSVYMKDILTYVDPSIFTPNQTALYILNIYEYICTIQSNPNTFLEKLSNMEQYCANIKEWTTIKNQIIVLNNLTGVVLDNKDTISAILLKTKHTTDLPELLLDT